MDYENSTQFQRNLVLLGVSILIIMGFAGAKNLATPDDPVNVGMVEVETECAGFDIGVCLGVQKQDHTTYNYDDYEEIEPGTENYYRFVESQIMLRASNTCDQSMEGYEWTSEVSYDGQTAEEWRENENIELLPCEKTFYREMGDSR